ncbi:MAG: PIN domain nuclease [Gammaproteobacteria bacterium]|nr:PIN domain nuclease [Gammaproteobacteria bacterium]
MILVDTSVWIDWLQRGNRPATIVLDRLIDEDDIALAPVILQELLQGARGPAQLAELRDRFAGMPMLEQTLQTYSAAGELYARCRWVGITPRSPHDCLIAITAIENGVPILHDDRDFGNLARVETRLQLLPRQRSR